MQSEGNRPLSTIHSSVCSSPLRFYASLPLTHLVCVDRHVPTGLGAPAPLVEMTWVGPERPSGGQRGRAPAQGGELTESEPACPTPHFALEPVSSPDVKNECLHAFEGGRDALAHQVRK